MSASPVDLMSFDNPVFRAYLFYSCILVLKVFAMVLITGRHRFAKKIFISPEDTKTIKGARSGIVDPDIERARRAHLNDLENIPFFFLAAYGYLMTNPAPFIAIMLMRLYTLARIAHTFVYTVVVIPQPARAISFFIGYFITAYMAIVTIFKFA